MNLPTGQWIWVLLRMFEELILRGLLCYRLVF